MPRPICRASATSELADRYRHHYFATRQHEIRCSTGTLAMLNDPKARHHWLGVATGKVAPRPGRGAAHGRAAGPVRRHAHRRRDRLQARSAHAARADARVRRRPERTLMIGDTTHDRQLAANAGTASIGVSYGAHEHEAFEARPRRASWRTPPPSCRWLARACLSRRGAPAAPVRLGRAGERGDAVLFDVLQWGQPARGFALRIDGRVGAYLNRCAHVPTEMDWQPGRFSSTASGQFIRLLPSTARPTSPRPALRRRPCGGRPRRHRGRGARRRGVLVSFPRHLGPFFPSETPERTWPREPA